MLKALELVRAYRVPIRDGRASELVTRYVGAPRQLRSDLIILSGDTASQSLLEGVES
ncbi:MAG: hypothetical protein RQ885_05200 [Desulfurococcales archaeon]|nr:hypothetical protein [Desulfurococcales archaeon]